MLLISLRDMPSAATLNNDSKKYLKEEWEKTVTQRKNSVHQPQSGVWPEQQFQLLLVIKSKPERIN